MGEVANISYEDSLQNESIHSQNEGFNNEGLSSKSIDDYINEQKSLLLQITDKNLQEHAQEEFQEVQEKFEALRGDATDTAALQLADLHQEFQRDISGMEKLDDGKLSNLLSQDEVKELISYVHGIGEQVEEQFYSILSNMSDSVFQSIIKEFQNAEYFEGDSLLVPDLMETFVDTILNKYQNKIEQQEITELINLDLNSITSTDQVEYYKQQIQYMSSYAQSEEEDQLKEVIDKLNQLVILEATSENTEATSENTEATSENTEATSENRKIQVEKKEERLDFIDRYTDIYLDIINNEKSLDIQNKYSEILGIMKVVSNIDKNNSNELETLDFINNELIDLLEAPSLEDSNKTVAEQFLLDLGKIDQKLYSKTLDLFNRTSDDLKQKLSHLPLIYSEPKSLVGDVLDFTSPVEVTMGEGSIVMGDKVMSQDGKKYMDLGVEPPQAYIRSENGFRLNTTVKFPNIITQKENEFKQESAQLEGLISEGKEDYSLKIGRKQQLERVKAQLESNEISIEEKNRLQEQYPNLDMEISQLSLEMDMLDTKIKENEKKLADMTAEFQREHKQAIDWYKAQVEAKDKKTQEVLKFLEGVGFNLIPQSITNSIIEQLNNPGNSSLRGLIGFNTLLNLSEGDLGFQTSFNDHTLGTTEKVIFAEFINRMISTNPGEPIDVTKILNGGSVPVEDRTKLSFQLEQAGLKDSGTAIGIAMDNLRKSTLEK